MSQKKVLRVRAISVNKPIATPKAAPNAAAKPINPGSIFVGLVSKRIPLCLTALSLPQILPS